MKTLKIFSIAALSLAFTTLSLPKGANAQAKTETFIVSGNCGMCKTKIEKAAKEAGASTATWNAETKELTIKYSSSSTNTAKIQQKIASVGYDNAGFKSSLEAYNKLHGCCKYERAEISAKESCCVGKCEMKDGKCTDMTACKDKGCCTADGVCKAGSECTKEGHNGKDCCKKSEQ